MASITDRLTTDFNVSRFGTDVNLSEKAKNYLNTSPVRVSAWAKSDLANGSISRSDYFQNPVASYVSSISSNVNSIITVCVNDPATNFPLAEQEVKNLANTANTLILELQQFLNHTNRLSGVSSLSANTEEDGLKPTYASCMAVGGVLLTLLSNTDNVDNASPILNNFTSLYIEDELVSNNWTIGNSTVFLSGADTLTEPAAIEQINVKLLTANTLLYTRRTSDENYYNSSLSIVRDFQLLNSLENAGSTERNLINNKIGTTKLKNIFTE